MDRPITGQNNLSGEKGVYSNIICLGQGLASPSCLAQDTARQGAHLEKEKDVLSANMLRISVSIAEGQEGLPTHLVYKGANSKSLYAE